MAQTFSTGAQFQLRTYCWCNAERMAKPSADGAVSSLCLPSCSLLP
ncbi:hypothetical protein BVRB_041270 [Beta vulgaris subsp. vulgaris]|uniref:Uncharacterized protein n=1 Tax=Beta vulgaris subsp. vulgaris TaxID=3555 RepID=A0A0J7YMX2_BETVV|nr:hypothetical protein BVRB_041270 [Beta vulgaris subsp. vulgaris]